MNLWKLYFWVYAVFTSIGLLIIVFLTNSLNFADWEGILESVTLVVGTYIFAYEKHTNSTIWKFTVSLIVSIWFLQLAYYLRIFPVLNTYSNILETNTVQDIGTVIFSMVLSVPALVAIYKLGFSRK